MPGLDGTQYRENDTLLSKEPGIRERSNEILRRAFPFIAIAITMIIVWLVSQLPEAIDASKERHAVLSAFGTLPALEFAEVTPGLNGSYILNLLDSEVGKSEILKTIRNSNELVLNHPYPIAECEVRLVPIIGKTIELDLEIAIMDGKGILMVTLIEISKRFGRERLGTFGSPELDRLLQDTQEQLKELYRSYTGK